MKKFMTGLALVCALVLLGACQKKTETKSSEAGNLLTSSTSSTDSKALAVRQNFDEIKLATAKKNFTDGTKLAKLKEYFGEPSSHKTEKPESGNITLDVYHWTVEGVSVEVKLYKDSALVRSIQGFSYSRSMTINKGTFDKIKKGDSYSDMVARLGSPDSLSEAVSSGKTELQAVWYSNVKSASSDNQAQMVLIFKNGKLTDKQESNMSSK